MHKSVNPIEGFVNPILALRLVDNGVMTSKRTRQPPTLLRSIVAENLQRLMDLRFQSSTDRYMALAQLSGLAKSTVQRAVSGETAANLDTLYCLATALRVKPTDLLVPFFGVEALNPSSGIVSQAKPIPPMKRRVSDAS